MGTPSLGYTQNGAELEFMIKDFIPHLEYGFVCIAKVNNKASV